MNFLKNILVLVVLSYAIVIPSFFLKRVISRDPKGQNHSGLGSGLTKDRLSSALGFIHEIPRIKPKDSFLYARYTVYHLSSSLPKLYLLFEK